MRLILYTGSGGAGTTSLAVATAKALGAAGNSVLLGAVADTDDLRDCVGPGDLDRHPGPADPLDAGHDPADPMERVTFLPTALGRPSSDWGNTQELLLRVLSRAGLDPAVAEEVPDLPGLDAVRAVFGILELTRRHDADVCVLDLGPWGSATELLALPSRLVWFLQRLIVAPTEFGSALRPFALLTGQRAGSAAVGIAQALVAAETVAHVLRSDQTRVRLVVGPSPEQVTRLARRVPQLALAGARVELLVVNRAAAPADRPPGSGRAPDPLPDVEVLSVPDVSGVAEPGSQGTGWPTAHSVTTCLARSVPELCRLDHPATCLAPRIEATDDGYRVTIRVPARVEDGARVQRRDDDLLISIAGRRHLVPLTGALRRCRVTGAEHGDGELRVAFRPDESRWPHGD